MCDHAYDHTQCLSSCVHNYNTLDQNGYLSISKCIMIPNPKKKEYLHNNSNPYMYMYMQGQIQKECGSVHQHIEFHNLHSIVYCMIANLAIMCKVH